MPDRTALRTGVVLAVVFLAVASGVAAAGPVAVEGVTLSGSAVVAGGDRPTVAGWRAMNVTASVTTGADTYDVCVEIRGAGSATRLGCQRVAGTNTTENVTLPVTAFPENATGARTIRVTVRSTEQSNTSEPLARSDRTVRLLTASGDVDDDGLDNRRELDAGTAFDVADTDGDGIEDGPEVNVHETDPTSTDTDGDGLSDGVEVNDQGTNPTEPDTDSDGLDDGVEVATYGTDPTSTDTDGDSLDDGPEVNVHQTDPTNTDTDGDGLEDGPEVNVHETDPTSTDTDGDGLNDRAEVEQYGTNPTEPDTDGDGLTDGREVNQYGTDPTRVDTDGDGRNDAEDVSAGGTPASGIGAIGVSPVWLGVVTVLVVAVGAGVALGVGGSRWRQRLTWPDVFGGGGQDGGETATADEGGVGTAGAPSRTHARETMTDEERVHDVLESSGGRMRQSAIVEETGWSKSKVSRVLSGMADDGVIEKVTLGRENLIAYPGNLPEGARSPFDADDQE